MANHRVRALLRWPAQLLAGAGLKWTFQNGAALAALDYPSLADVANVADPSDYTVAVYRKSNQAYGELGLNNLPAVANPFPRTSFGDADYVASPADRYIGLTAALTAPRTLTLPAASAFPSGMILTVQDEAGGISSTNTLTVARAGADTINGATSYVLNSARSGVELRSDGISKWSFAPSGVSDGSVTTAKLAGESVTTPKLASSALGYADGLVNGCLAASVAGNALTVAVKTKAGADPSAADPVLIVFRNAAAGTGDYTVLSLTAALSLVVSSGSTLGASNGAPFRLWIVALNDGATVRLGAVNCRTSAGVIPLPESALQSATAEGGAGAADSAGVIYAGAAVASKPMRLLGFMTWEAGLTTAGAWDAAPSVVQMLGPGVRRPGDVVQTIVMSTNAVATGTATIPNDDTIPQSGEGTQFLSGSITPTSKANELIHENAIGYAANITAAWVIAALFQDSDANAIASNHTYVHPTANAAIPVPILHRMLAGTTAAITFKLRAGLSAAGTLTFCGVNGARFLGGSKTVGHVIREIMA